jgi:uncharacterized membrane protein YfcA
MILFIILILFGLLSGILAGLLGIGGGIVFLPLAKFYFIDYLGHDIAFMKVLIATSSAIIIVNSSSSLYRHYKLDHIEFKLIPYLVIPALIGSQIGGSLTKLLNPVYLKNILGVSLFLFALKMLFSKKNKAREGDFNKNKKILLFLSVFLVSIFASMLGIGGGAFIVPILFMLSGAPFKKVIGTAPIFKLFVSLGAVVLYMMSESNITPIKGHFQIGYVDINIWFFTAIGGFVGAQFGAILTSKLKADSIRYIFIGLLVLSSYKMTF